MTPEQFHILKRLSSEHYRHTLQKNVCFLKVNIPGPPAQLKYLTSPDEGYRCSYTECKYVKIFDMIYADFELGLCDTRPKKWSLTFKDRCCIPKDFQRYLERRSHDPK